ncbi:MAG: hypothetical protein JXM73_14035 [Anaerolineae bacterium]|nr:hypothetical protein [Anaerolineae bacterium]
MQTIKVVLIGLGVFFLVVFVPTLIFLAVDQDVAAAVTGTMTVGVLLAITHVAAFAAGTWYTRTAMHMGADIALRAQETNDRWDERKTKVFGDLVREGARIGRASAPSAEILPLPVPSQDISWLPAPTEFGQPASLSIDEPDFER